MSVDNKSSEREKYIFVVMTREITSMDCITGTPFCSFDDEELAHQSAFTEIVNEIAMTDIELDQDELQQLVEKVTEISRDDCTWEQRCEQLTDAIDEHLEWSQHFSEYAEIRLFLKWFWVEKVELENHAPKSYSLLPDQLAEFAAELKLNKDKEQTKKRKRQPANCSQ